jgi:4-hydroxybenzoyl-CoA reductase subunit beta
MLTLLPFQVHAPKDLASLQGLLATASATTKIMAGGTDLLPNLKHGLYQISDIIALKGITELRQIELTEEELIINAGVTLHDLSLHSGVLRVCPSLAYAASLIASPQIRRMGTVGGNLGLDTRCLYFNQTPFWRSALGYCLKKDGCACHVIPTGKRCVAAAANDLATMLLALDAKLTIWSPSGSKWVALGDFYVNNGEKNHSLTPQEVIMKISVSLKRYQHSGFSKLRFRNSIDFPLLSIGVAFNLDHDQRLTSGRLVLNALVAKPKVIDLDFVRGLGYNTDLIEAVAAQALAVGHPQTNLAGDKDWRKHMIKIFVREALVNALAVDT